LGGLRAKLPGANKGGDRPAAARGTPTAGNRSFGGPSTGRGTSSPGLGSRSATSASSAPSARSAAAGQSGGILSRLPFVGGGSEARSRPTSTRERMQRASKAPKIDESGLSLDSKLDILGVILVLSSLALFFSSMSTTKGQLTESVNTFFSQLLGKGAIAVPVVMLAIGVWLIVRHFGDEAPVIDPVRVGGIILLYLGALLLFQFLESFNPDYAGINLSNPDELRLQLEISYNRGLGGGWIGSSIYHFLVTNITEAGMVVSMAGLWFIGVMLLMRISAAEVAVFVISLWRSFIDARRRRSQTREARARMGGRFERTGATGPSADSGSALAGSRW
jgi:hypothetical protein